MLHAFSARNNICLLYTSPGIDGITMEEIGAYLRENQKELIERIRRGKYTPDPVRRVDVYKRQPLYSVENAL